MKTTIVGSGVAGLTSAINIKLLLPNSEITVWSKTQNQFECDSFLAQGGICVEKDENDYRSFFDDTIAAGHFSNDLKAVDKLVRNSKKAIEFLESCEVQFDRNENGEYDFTKEGGHSTNRILHSSDKTGKEITEKLAKKASGLGIEIKHGDFFVENDNFNFGQNHHLVLATGGVGGMFQNSTNFPSLTGDGVKFAKKQGAIIVKEHENQIHPTGFFDQTKTEKRCFLISESLRGEGAVLLNSKMERFTNELQPRDVLTTAIKRQMVIDGSDFVYLDARKVFESEEKFEDRFPAIFNHLIERGVNPKTDLIKVVPTQHFFQGGIAVDLDGRALTLENGKIEESDSFNQTPENVKPIEGLWAVGETAYSGVHGDNRLASNSLLECVVWGLSCAEGISNELKKDRGQNR